MSQPSLEPISQGPVSPVRFCGRYTLLEKVGQGGQGQVWRALDDVRGVEVALKVLQARYSQGPDPWSSLNREYTIASPLDHPFILKVYPPEKDGDVVFLPMEFVSGGNIGRLRRASYLDIVPALLEVSQALAYVHARGVIHGDLKPSNVLIDAGGHVRLADFGVASRAIPATPEQSAPVGLSPLTASPEQLRGEPPSVADDVYGLGALACDLLTGRSPYLYRLDNGCSRDDTAARIEPAQPAPVRLIALVQDMLATARDQRPGSMQEIIERLEDAVNDTIAFKPVRPALELAEVAEAQAGPKLISSGDRAQVDEREAPAVLAPKSPSQIPSGAPESRETPRLAATEWSPELAPIRAILDSPSGDTASRPVRQPIRASRSTASSNRSAARRVSKWIGGLAGLAAVVAGGVLLISRGPARVHSWADSSLVSLQHLKTRRIASEVASRLDALNGSTSAHAEATRRDPSPAPRRTTSNKTSPTVQDVRNVSRRLNARLATLEAHGAAQWGAGLYTELKTLNAEADGANEAGDPALAMRMLGEAQMKLAALERAQPRKAKVRASGKGGDRVLRRLVAGLNAEVSGDGTRAAREFKRVLALDPGNAVALAGLQREGGTRTAPAHPVEPAAENPAPVMPRLNSGPELADVASIHEPVRAELARSMQALLAEPDSIQVGPLHAEAEALIREEKATPDPSAPLQALAARLSYLLKHPPPKLVRVALISDNRTYVEITQIGEFGTFLRREIDLRPGEYTVIGRRPGYRSVRRQVVVEPGAGTELVQVRCQVPI